VVKERGRGPQGSQKKGRARQARLRKGRILRRPKGKEKEKSRACPDQEKRDDLARPSKKKKSGPKRMHKRGVYRPQKKRGRSKSVVRRGGRAPPKGIKRKGRGGAQRRKEAADGVQRGGRNFFLRGRNGQRADPNLLGVEKEKRL